MSISSKSVVFLPIGHCRNCPNKFEDNHWTSDGWDRMEDWRCKKVKDGDEYRKIAGAVEWHEEKGIKIPEWCPLNTFEVVLVSDDKEKGFTAFYKNFSNIVSQGESEEEAITNLTNTLYDVIKHFTK